MNRKKIGLTRGAWIVLIIVVFIVGCNVYQNNRFYPYEGNGIPYIVAMNNTCQLSVYNSDGIYKEKLGDKATYFWFTSAIYENETLSVDNNNKIYRFTEEEIETYSNIETNIIAVLKVGKNYIIISGDGPSVHINLYSEDFSERISSQKVSGSFGYCFVEANTLYYSVLGMDEEQYSGVYRYNTENHSNEQVYSSEESEEIYPFEYQGTLYIAKNKRITKAGNIDVCELYERQESGEFVKVLDLEEPLRKVLIVDGDVYGLLGMNSTSILKMNLPEHNQEKLFTLDGEAARGLYYFEGKIQVLTIYSIYHLEGGKLLKRHNSGSIELENEFY